MNSILTMYFSGKISHIIKFICYSVLGGVLVLRRDDAHRVKVYHGKAYIDCDVDGDNDSNTCLSDFTVVHSFRFNAGYVFGSALCIAGIMSLVEIIYHKQHMYSNIYYYDAIVVNTLLTFGIAVVCGTQELATLVLLMLNVFMYESAIYVHDIGFWNSGTFDGYNHWGRISILILLNVVTWVVILSGLIEYWVNSTTELPMFIPTIGIIGFINMILMRFFHYHYIYGTIPGKIVDVTDKESQKLFDKEPYNNKSSQTKYETLLKVNPFVVEWGDSWKNICNLLFRMTVGIAFFVGTNTIKITYR